MGARRRSRALALALLYELEFHPAGEEEAIATFWATHPVPPPVRAFAEELTEGTRTHRTEIDALITEQVEHWSPSRLALVDRNILRLAVYELLYREDTPPKVVINEAIEIAKTYGGEDSGGFVNGILDAVKNRALPPHPALSP